MTAEYDSKKLSVALCLFVSLLLGTEVLGVVIRDDVADSEYIALGTDPLYEAAGAWLPNSALCAATLLSPDWVITAGHCLPGASNDASFALGATSAAPDLLVDADQFALDPNYDLNNVTAGYDVAVAHLSQPVLNVTPAQLFRAITGERSQVATFVGYGRTGTGLSGDNMPNGTRRGATNVIDRYGGQVGWTANVLAGDFDNPNNAGDSVWLPSEPLPMEGMIGLNDSGSPWFIESNGVNYLAAITSYRASQDPTVDSDYGDIFGLMRINKHLTFIDGAANVAFFWNATSGSWGTAGDWDSGIAPDSTRTAVISQGVSTVSPGAVAQYTFVDWNGRLEMDNDLTSESLMLKRGGVVSVGDAAPGIVTLAGNLKQTDGNLNIVLHGLSQNGTLTVSGTAEIGGQLLTENSAGYAGPATRGDISPHLVLTANNVVGSFDSVDGEVFGPGYNYVGETEGGLDGLFRSLTYSGSTVTLHEYLALPGDANGDGSVDVADFNIWNANKFTFGNAWTSGDFNGDGITDISDFNIWNGRKFTTISLPRAAVPEPSTLALLLLALAAAVAICRRKP